MFIADGAVLPHVLFEGSCSYTFLLLILLLLHLLFLLLMLLLEVFFFTFCCRARKYRIKLKEFLSVLCLVSFFVLFFQSILLFSLSLSLSLCLVVGTHVDLTLLHSCTFISLVTELLCALDHSSNAFALAQGCHKIELQLSLLFVFSLCLSCLSYLLTHLPLHGLSLSLFTSHGPS